MISEIKLSRNHSRSRTKSSKGGSYDKLKRSSLSKSVGRSGAGTAGILTKAASREIDDAYGNARNGTKNSRNKTQLNSAVSHVDTPSNPPLKNV